MSHSLLRRGYKDEVRLKLSYRKHNAGMKLQMKASELLTNAEGSNKVFIFHFTSSCLNDWLYMKEEQILINLYLFQML